MANARYLLTLPATTRLLELVANLMLLTALAHPSRADADMTYRVQLANSSSSGLYLVASFAHAHQLKPSSAQSSAAQESAARFGEEPRLTNIDPLVLHLEEDPPTREDSTRKASPKDDSLKVYPPKDDSPKDDNPKYDSPKEASPNEGSPKDDSPKDDSLLEDSTKEDSPKEDLTKEDSTKFESIVAESGGSDAVPVSPSTQRSAPAPSRHPCARTCVQGAPPMSCRFRFVLEAYHSLSKACFDCPANASDCQRPHCVPVDGVARPLVVVNRQLPGPSLQVCLGDRITVDLENHLLEASSSIHWHGHHQRGTPYMDGVPYVTQCPVPPRASFRYRYVADTPGTHFWHSHSGCQRADGAFGALVVRVPRSLDAHAHLFDKDLAEHTMQLLDWTHARGEDKFLKHHHGDGDNKPDTVLINGRGRFLRQTDQLASQHLATFTVQKGLRFRFRLINAGFLNCPLQLSVDNHTLLVIASDGSDLKPVEVASLVSYAGERFDFVLSAQEPVGRYWVRVRGLMDCDERFTSAHQLAVLHYEGADPHGDPPGPTSYEAGRREGLTLNALNAAPATNASLTIPELDAAVADDAASLQVDADVTFYLSYDFYPLDNPMFHRAPFYGFYQVAHKKQRVFTPQLNHVSMRMPRAPPLSQPDDLDPATVCAPSASATNCTSGNFCSCTHILRVPLGALVELVIVDEGETYDANHPFHLHGAAFRVVAMDRLGSTTSAAAVRALDAAGLIRRKLRNAPLKDTVTVPDGGYTIVRFHANNPGFWLFHCHIEFHVELGMAVVFHVGETSDVPAVPRGFPRCGDYLPDDDAEVEVVPLPTQGRAGRVGARSRLRDASAHSAARSSTAPAALLASACSFLFLLLRPA